MDLPELWTPTWDGEPSAETSGPSPIVGLDECEWLGDMPMLIGELLALIVGVTVAVNRK